MAAEMAGCASYQHDLNDMRVYNNESELSSLLSLAQIKSYSKQGEMFSAMNLAALAWEYYGLCAKAMSDSFSDRDKVLKHLLQGGLVLVPYDAAPNHEPCLLNGRKAHWAVITGFLFAFNDDTYDWQNVATSPEILTQEPVCYSITNPTKIQDFDLPNNIVPDHVYVLAKQPKSRHTSVWSLQSLEKSNCNLFEFCPSKNEEMEDFIFPDGGLREGLCGKLIFLSKSDSEL